MPLAFADRYDAIVVGARVAGAATAMLLAREGASVLMVERDAPGTDTLSTHALMRGGVMLLARWGLLNRVVAAGAPPVTATAFIYGSDEVVVPIRPSDGADALYAPRRTSLDPILARAACEAGVDLRYGCALEELVHDPRGRVVGAMLRRGERIIEVRADRVIGADGRRSKVARLVGADTRVRGVNAAAAVYAYVDGMTNRGYRWHFGSGAAAGAIPTNGRRHAVFASMPPARLRALGGNLAGGLQAVLEEVSPALAEEVAGASAMSRAVGFAGIPGYLRSATGPGWALVGDAGYFKDPLTAHGITDALRDAALLAEAVSVGSASAMASYQRTRDELSLPLFRVTDRLAGLDWSFDEAKELHAALHVAMRAEVEALRELTREAA